MDRTQQDTEDSKAREQSSKKRIDDVIVTRIVVIVLGILIVGAPAYVTKCYNDRIDKRIDRAQILQYRKYMIEEALGRDSRIYVANKSLIDGIKLIEQEAPDRQPYYIGEIKPELSNKLPDYVEKYNADPSTEYPVSEEEVRYGLTEGLFETLITGENEAAYRLRLFFNWCNYNIRRGNL